MDTAHEPNSVAAAPSSDHAVLAAVEAADVEGLEDALTVRRTHTLSAAICLCLCLSVSVSVSVCLSLSLRLGSQWGLACLLQRSPQRYAPVHHRGSTTLIKYSKQTKVKALRLAKW